MNEKRAGYFEATAGAAVWIGGLVLCGSFEISNPLYGIGLVFSLFGGVILGVGCRRIANADGGAS